MYFEAPVKLIKKREISVSVPYRYLQVYIVVDYNLMAR